LEGVAFEPSGPDAEAQNLMVFRETSEKAKPSQLHRAGRTLKRVQAMVWAFLVSVSILAPSLT
jgi:hypothetical protein